MRIIGYGIQLIFIVVLMTLICAVWLAPMGVAIYKDDWVIMFVYIVYCIPATVMSIILTGLMKAIASID